MPPKANTIADPPRSEGSNLSGKLVIVGIVFVALLAAGISWYFRYQATHRAVKFWGPEASVLIRDAPVVTLGNGGNTQGATPADVQANIPATGIDVSRARGLTYLRNALLEDHNYDWTTGDRTPSDSPLSWWLKFKDPQSGKDTVVILSNDFRVAFYYERTNPDGSLQSARSAFFDPVMTKGLREMFAEFSAAASPDGAKPPAAGEATEPAR